VEDNSEIICLENNKSFVSTSKIYGNAQELKLTSENVIHVNKSLNDSVKELQQPYNPRIKAE